MKEENNADDRSKTVAHFISPNLWTKKRHTIITTDFKTILLCADTKMFFKLQLFLKMTFTFNNLILFYFILQSVKKHEIRKTLILYIKSELNFVFLPNKIIILVVYFKIGERLPSVIESDHPQQIKLRYVKLNVNNTIKELDITVKY